MEVLPTRPYFPPPGVQDELPLPPYVRSMHDVEPKATVLTALFPCVSSWWGAVIAFDLKVRRYFDRRQARRQSFPPTVYVLLHGDRHYGRTFPDTTCAGCTIDTGHSSRYRTVPHHLYYTTVVVEQKPTVYHLYTVVVVVRRNQISPASCYDSTPHIIIIQYSAIQSHFFLARHAALECLHQDAAELVLLLRSDSPQPKLIKAMQNLLHCLLFVCYGGHRYLTIMWIKWCHYIHDEEESEREREIQIVTKPLTIISSYSIVLVALLA